MTRGEKLHEALRVLKSRLPEISGAALVNREGFIEATVLPTDVNEALVAEMSTALLDAGERVAHGLMRAAMEQTYVRTPNGYIIVHSVGEGAALVLLVTREARLGLIFLELKRTTTDIAPLL